MLFIMDLGCDVRNRFSVLVCFGGWIKCHVQTFLCFAILVISQDIYIDTDIIVTNATWFWHFYDKINIFNVNEIFWTNRLNKNNI